MPDPLSDETEVLDVYTGDTLEEAMAAAVAALGPGLQVRRARKVRSGVRGLMGRELYEVLAAPGPGGARPPAADSGDAVGDALDRLLGDADAAEAEAAGEPGDAADATGGRRLFGRRPPVAPDSAPAQTPPAGDVPTGGPAGPAHPTAPAGPATNGVGALPEAPHAPAADPALPARTVPPAPVGRHARVDSEPPVVPAPPAGSGSSSPAFEVPPAIAAALAARAARLYGTGDPEPAPPVVPASDVPGLGLPGVDLSPTSSPGLSDADSGSRRGARSVRAAARAAARQDLGAGSRRTAGAAAARRPRYGAPRLDEPVPHPDLAVAEHRHAADAPADADLPRRPAPPGAEDAAPPHPAHAAPPGGLAAPAAPPPVTPRPVTGRPATTRPSGAPSARALGWSRSALQRLGVPAPVVAALPASDPVDDLGWLTALTEAISAVVPPPGELGPDVPVVVSGYGLDGALGVLREGCRGAVPGVLVSADRTAPATAVEIALVLRAAMTDG